jgi:hypothetical protein
MCAATCGIPCDVSRSQLPAPDQLPSITQIFQNASNCVLASSPSGVVVFAP